MSIKADDPRRSSTGVTPGLEDASAPGPRHKMVRRLVVLRKQEPEKLTNERAQLRDALTDNVGERCAKCAYFTEPNQCAIIVGPVGPDAVCDWIYSRGVDGAPKYDLSEDDWVAFGVGMIAEQPYQHIVRDVANTPAGQLVLIEDTAKPPHRFSLTRDFHVEHTSFEHHWTQAEVDALIAVGRAEMSKFEIVPHYKRHRDDEYVDGVRLEVVPRYKTSGLSGDEWRTSVRVCLYRKGEVVKSRTYGNVEYAAAHLPWLLKTWGEEMNSAEWDESQKRAERDKTMCHQVGCAEPATTTYALKREFTHMGDEIPIDPERPIYRAFCKRHAVRGDCGLEDADDNYEVVEGHGPDGAGELSEDESPSVFGGYL